MTKEEFKDFQKEFQRIKISNSNRDEKLLKFYDQMEKDFQFVGASAIEDKLQEGVPEAIAKIIETGIRIWVLTGDKQETAVEIGRSCKLI